MNAIANFDTYNSRMSMGMYDKIHFFRNIDAKYWVDYGCADGSMIEILATMNPKNYYIGYDNDPTMVKLAKKKTMHLGNVTIMSNFDTMAATLKILKKATQAKSAIILSSIVHEIYAYLYQDGIDNFWKQVFTNDFDYVTLRDMYVPKTPPQQAKKLSPRNIHWEHILGIKANPLMLADFKRVYGHIETEQQQIHFLLKYRYIDNWQRELHEDYLAFSNNSGLLTNSIQKYGYKRNWSSTYALPFLVETVRNDFGIDLSDRVTHMKLILEKQ